MTLPNPTRFLALTVTLAALMGCSKKVRIGSSSMEPTLKKGSVVSIDIHAYTRAAPDRWDLVAFTSPLDAAGTWVFRVVGLPGETIEIREGKLMINGKVEPIPPSLRIGNYKSPDPAVNPPGTGPITFPFQIPTDSCFVLGDNVSNALDSRYWGALKQRHVLGKVSAP